MPQIPSPYPEDYDPRNAATLSKEIVEELRAKYADQLAALKAAPTPERKTSMAVINDIEWLLFAVDSLAAIVLREVPEKH